MSRLGHIRTTGRVLVKVRHCDCAAPAHLDVLNGTARPVNALDGGGPIDRRIHRHASAMRVRRVFAARRSLGRPGEMDLYFADDERDRGLDRVLALELSEPSAAIDLCRDLMESPEVEWATPEPLSFAPLDANALVTPMSVLPSVEAIRRPHERVRAFEALTMEPGDRQIIVACVDTGVALDHDEFAGRIYGGIDTVDLGLGSIGDDVELVGDSRGRDFCARDETGHGSHVAGIMCARGLFVPKGLAGLSSLAPVRALAAARGPDGQVVGIGGTLDIDAAIKAAGDMGARVLNLSFGTSENELFEGAPGVHRDSIDYVLSLGAVPVAAMGNSGREEVYYPAALPGVIAVGAIEEDGRRSDFSTMGDHISISAPGDEIISVGLEGYRASTGTSHAAPFVSATVALMLARSNRAGVALTATDCREILQDTARPGHPNEPTSAIGAGQLDAAAALTRTNSVIADRKGG
ncbi:MAG: S8 family serine peptidase [Dinoroseobacter sp.]|nr:S8 family serine peptidase [Dinoroseobacter sp.]